MPNTTSCIEHSFVQVYIQQLYISATSEG